MGPKQAVDSTGIKAANDGEWNARKHAARYGGSGAGSNLSSTMKRRRKGREVTEAPNCELQLPKTGGKSRNGEPVRPRKGKASRNRRMASAIASTSPIVPDKCASNRRHARSVTTKRRRCVQTSIADGRISRQTPCETGWSTGPNNRSRNRCVHGRRHWRHSVPPAALSLYRKTTRSPRQGPRSHMPLFPIREGSR